MVYHLELSLEAGARCPCMGRPGHEHLWEVEVDWDGAGAPMLRSADCAELGLEAIPGHDAPLYWAPGQLRRVRLSVEGADTDEVG